MINFLSRVQDYYCRAVSIVRGMQYATSALCRHNNAVRARLTFLGAKLRVCEQMSESDAAFAHPREKRSTRANASRESRLRNA